MTFSLEGGHVENFISPHTQSSSSKSSFHISVSKFLTSINFGFFPFFLLLSSTGLTLFSYSSFPSLSSFLKWKNMACF